MGGVFSRVWAVFQQQWPMCLAGWAAAAGLNFGVAVVLEIVSALLRVAMKDMAIPLLVVIAIGRVLFNAWISTGLGLFALRLARGEEARFGDLFAGGPYLWRILGGSLLYFLVGYVGLVLLIIPGVVWFLMFSQFYYLILDRNLSIMDAFSMSRELTRGNKLTLWAIGMIAWLLGFAVVVLTCGLGVFAVAPYWLLLVPVIYLMMSGQPTLEELRYGPPPTV